MWVTAVQVLKISSDIITSLIAPCRRSGIAFEEFSPASKIPWPRGFLKSSWSFWEYEGAVHCKNIRLFVFMPALFFRVLANFLNNDDMKYFSRPIQQGFLENNDLKNSLGRRICKDPFQFRNHFAARATRSLLSVWEWQRATAPCKG